MAQLAWHALGTHPAGHYITTTGLTTQLSCILLHVIMSIDLLD